MILFLDTPNSKEAKGIIEDNKDIKEAIVRKMSKDEKLARLAEKNKYLDKIPN